MSKTSKIIDLKMLDYEFPNDAFFVRIIKKVRDENLNESMMVVNDKDYYINSWSDPQFNAELAFKHNRTLGISSLMSMNGRCSKNLGFMAPVYRQDNNKIGSEN